MQARAGRQHRGILHGTAAQDTGIECNSHAFSMNAVVGCCGFAGCCGTQSGGRQLLAFIGAHGSNMEEEAE